jgi:ribose transport system substrate-binding protein
MITIKGRLVTFAAAFALVLTGCTSGSTAPNDESGEGASGTGVAPVVQPLEVREFVHSKVKGKRIAFVPMLFKGFPLTEQWYAHMERALGPMGAELSVHDANWDTDQMIRILNDLISNHKADVLVLHNPDLSVLSKQIKDAQAEGIYVVVLNMISSQSGDAFVGADVVTAAQDIARRAAEDCKAKGASSIAVIEGAGPDGFSVQFREGVNKVAKEEGLDVVDILQSNWQPDQANQQARTLVQRYGDKLCGLMLPWDGIAIPAAEAVAGAGKTGAIGVYTLDGSKDVCEAIRAGKVTATAAYDTPAMGTSAAVIIQQLLQVGDAPGTRRTVSYVDHVIVDKSNVGEVASACYSGK